jgi:hypothetical protein
MNIQDERIQAACEHLTLKADLNGQRALVSNVAGHGDIRIYVLVQFLPMLLIPVLLLVFKPRFTLTSGYWVLLLAYALAKVLEYYDKGLFESLGFISGHSLKHIMAAVGVFLLLRAYTIREKL